MTSASGNLARVLVVLSACVACGGRSRAVHSERGAGEPLDAGGLEWNDAATNPGDASVPGRDAGACAATSLTFGRPPRQLSFAISRSIAMGEPVSSDDPRTRLEATVSALLPVLDRLEQSTIVGLVITPSDERCSWWTGYPPTRLGEGSVRERLRTMLTEVAPASNWGSLAMTLWASYEQFGAVSDGDREIVVFLDDPLALSRECDAPVPLHGALTSAQGSYARGSARPYFVAVPGSGAGVTARDLAEASGCVDCYDDFSAEPAFAELLAERLLSRPSVDYSCDFLVPASPDGVELDLETLSMTAFYEDGASWSLARGSDCTAGAGFTVSADQQVISLCERSCAEFTGTARGTLEITIGCAEP